MVGLTLKSFVRVEDGVAPALVEAADAGADPVILEKHLNLVPSSPEKRGLRPRAVLVGFPVARRRARDSSSGLHRGGGRGPWEGARRSRVK